MYGFYFAQDSTGPDPDQDSGMGTYVARFGAFGSFTFFTFFTPPAFLGDFTFLGDFPTFFGILC